MPKSPKYCEDYYISDLHRVEDCRECRRLARSNEPKPKRRCECGHWYSDHTDGEECFYSYNCGCKRYTPEIDLLRAYGWGI